MVTETMKGHLGWIVEKKEVITAVCLGYGNRRRVTQLPMVPGNRKGMKFAHPEGWLPQSIVKKRPAH